MFIVLLSPPSQDYRLYLKDSRIVQDLDAQGCGTNQSSKALRFESSLLAARVASKIPFFTEASVVNDDDATWSSSLFARIELGQARLRVLKVNSEIAIRVAQDELEKLMEQDLEECLKNLEECLKNR